MRKDLPLLHLSIATFVHPPSSKHTTWFKSWLRDRPRYTATQVPSPSFGATSYVEAPDLPSDARGAHMRVPCFSNRHDLAHDGASMHEAATLAVPRSYSHSIPRGAMVFGHHRQYHEPDFYTPLSYMPPMTKSLSGDHLRPIDTHPSSTNSYTATSYYALTAMTLQARLYPIPPHRIKMTTSAFPRPQQRQDIPID